MATSNDRAFGRINKVTITEPATGATLTIVEGKTLTVSKTIELTSPDDTSVITFPAGTKTLVATDGNISGTAANLSGTPTLPSGTILVASALGTPTSGNLANCVGLPAAGLWTQTTGTFTAAPPLSVVATATFTFTASTAVTASPNCLALGVKEGMMIFNSTDDARASAKQILSISENGIDIVLAVAYAGTAGAAKEATIFGRTLTMTSDLTASIKEGVSLEYIIGGTTYYGQVEDGGIASNLLTVRGAPLIGDVTSLKYGGGTLHQVAIIIPGTYEDASNTALISSDLKSNLPWDRETGYCVHFNLWSNTHDSTTHGQGSVRINNTEVCTHAGGLYIADGVTPYSSSVNIATAAYDINMGEKIEVTSIKAGAGDASDLTVKMVILVP